MTDAYLEVCIPKIEGIRFTHRAHSKFPPLTAGVHSVELHGRDRHARKGRESAITSERRGELRSGE